MTLCIITHVLHTQKESSYFAYSPYVNEMNIWLKYVDHAIVVAPLEKFELNPIHTSYQHSNIDFVAAERFNTISFSAVLKSVVAVPVNCWRIFKAMKKADHIHLRCPGNMGLLGCIVQIAFPKKKKSTKYAGNWDPNSKQPLSYRIQKWILKNTFLTKNMDALVYGIWDSDSQNITPFFTATYSENEKTVIARRELKDALEFIFVGSLTEGKQPLYAIQLIEKLSKQNCNVHLSLYGDGPERKRLEEYVKTNALESKVAVKGPQDKETIKKVYQQSHFLVLPSKSEGWPKVVAEAMFWGCLPMASSVSCIPFMLDHGNRGVLLTNNLEQDVTQIMQLCNDEKIYSDKANSAINWSRNYTTDVFENAIQKIIQA